MLNPIVRTSLQVCMVAGLFACALSVDAFDAGLPVSVEIPQDGLATVVIDGPDGMRVCNLVSEMPVTKGKRTWIWDLYDVGDQKNEKSAYIRNLVKPGVYRVHGLTSDRITPTYEFSVYSPGYPAWKTADGTGSWLSDHCAPLDVIWLPNGSHLGKQPQLMMCSVMAESGTAIMWIDEKEKKLGGGTWGWDGATALARDAGTKADPKVVAYGLSDGLSSFTTEGKRVKVIDLPSPLKPWPVISDWQFLDLAVQDGLAVISNSDNRDNIDTTTGNLLVISMTAPARVLANHVTAPSRGVTFGPDGRLYALLGNDLHCMTVDRTTGQFANDTVLVKGLEEPRRVRVLDRELYIGLWGTRNQVEVYDLNGKKLRSIGKPGGLQFGRYDEQRMQCPEGMALTPDGTLWVMENTMVPKRISRWNAKTGAFVSATYGRPLYGGGGVLDPYDKSIFYYPHMWQELAGLRFKLDWTTGTSRLETIYHRTPLRSRENSQTWNGLDPKCPKSVSPRFDTGVEPALYGRPPALAFRAGGHRYLATLGDHRGGGAPGDGALWLADGDIIRPVALLGDLRGYFERAERAKELKPAWEKAGHPGAVWSDSNFNGRMDPEEVQFIASPKGGRSIQGVSFEKDLAVTLLNLRGGRLPAPSIDEHGVPHWDASKVAPVCEQGDQQGSPLVGEKWVVLSSVGWEHYTNPYGYRRDGPLAWSYRHYCANNIPQFPGQMVWGPHALGPIMHPPKGEAGEIWCTNGEKGAYYLMTADGLFLRTIGGHQAVRPLWHMPEAKRGMAIENVSFEDEDFGCSMQQCEDGEVYMVAGKEHSSILRIAGLETVKRRDWGTLTVTEKDLAGLPPKLEEWPTIQRRKEVDTFTVKAAQVPTVDGDLGEWQRLPPTAWATIDRAASAALLIGPDRLYAAFRTGDAKLLDNSVKDWRYLFKGGGALDLCIATSDDDRSEPKEGDCRLLVAKLGGKPIAVLYRQVAPKASPGERCVFESPIGKEVFASVTDVTKDLQFGERDGNYEFSIPLTVVLRAMPVGNKPNDITQWGYQPWHEQERLTLGDFGIIRGDGTMNIQRVCWNNLDTQIVSDIPSEVRLKPKFWGQWKMSPLENILALTPQPSPKPASAKRGLSWEYWETGADPSKDEKAAAKELEAWAFMAKPPMAKGDADRCKLDMRKRDRGFGLRFRGWVEVPADGWYRFDVWGDTAARLQLGGQTLVDLPHWACSGQRIVAIQLKAGTYPLEIDYRKLGSGRIELIVDWTGPTFGQRAMTEGLWHE